MSTGFMRGTNLWISNEHPEDSRYAKGADLEPRNFSIAISLIMLEVFKFNEEPQGFKKYFEVKEIRLFTNYFTEVCPNDLPLKKCSIINSFG